MLMSCLAGSLEFYFLRACFEQIILHEVYSIIPCVVAHEFQMKAQ